MAITLDKIILATNAIKTNFPQEDLLNTAFTFSINSKQITKNCIFIAIENIKDGHDFAKQAVNNGAKYVICHRKLDNNIAQILVSDTTIALMKLAKWVRNNTSTKIIGVCGSIGKTSLKDAIFQLLDQSHKYKSQGGYNNKFGMNLALANMPLNSQTAVFEIGISMQGEMDVLASILRPNITILTYIGHAHIANFKNKIELMKEKSVIFNHTVDTVILDKKGEFYNYLAQKAKKLKLSIIAINSYNIRIKEKHYLPFCSSIKVNFFKKDIHYKLKTFKAHWINTSLFLLAIVKTLGISIEKFKEIISKITELPGRGQMLDLIYQNKKITIIDDSYNASFESMRETINSFSLLKTEGRKIIIMADLVETGSLCKKIHETLLNYAIKTNINIIILLGDIFASHIQCINITKNNVYCIKNLEQLYKKLNKIIQERDTLLFKGSNNMKLFDVIDKMKKENLEIIS